MNVVIILEHRFLRSSEKSVWTETAFTYDFFKRYLDIFDFVRVVARVLDIEEFPDTVNRADGDKVDFIPVPYYLGPWQFILRYQKIISAIKDEIKSKDAVIMRVPSLLANLIEPVLRKRGQPYALEVVGDPWDVFAPGAVRCLPLVRIFSRLWFTVMLRKQCREAIAVSYVTKYYLQKRYPTKNIQVGLSDVEINETSLKYVNRRYEKNKFSYTLITVSTLDQMYKRVDTLISAVAICIKRGLNINLVIIGDGKFRPYLEAFCKKCGVENNVIFLGKLPSGRPIYEQLDKADLFVLASRQEGLPRAMIEAMARGLPCIGTNVGGIPELLPPEDLVPPNDAKALASKIAEALSDPERMNRMSERNYRKALEYREEVLSEKRRAFYRVVRELTEKWQVKNLSINHEIK